MTATREFFIGQDYYGSAPAPDEIVHNETHQQIGQAFFCPICSDIWARAVISGCPTAVRHRPCERHDPGFKLGRNSLGHVSSGEIPGSMYLMESRSWNLGLPDAVIRREFLLHLKWASRSPVMEKVVASIAEDIYNCLYQPRSKR